MPTLLQPPQELDEGLFYVRVWRGIEGDPPLETRYTSLKEALAVVNAVHRAGGYRRMEFLQAREWAEITRSAVA